MSVKPEILNELEETGLAIVPGVLDSAEVLQLKSELESAISEDAVNYPDVFDKGMVHNCVGRGARMAAILDNPVMVSYLNACFSETCIVYAYQSSSLPPDSGNYGSRVHVDSPRFIPNYDTNMGVIFPLDPFTVDNGATYFLPGSHRLDNYELPGDDFFYENAERALCDAGDMVLINPRLMHAAGINRTQNTRHALTLNFCRSYMKQRFDLPRLLSQEVVDSLGEDGKRLVGFNVRVPTSLEEFYLPEDERLYKPNQG